jgi:hypothetical protein
MKRKPAAVQPKTINKVVNYLERELGLTITGPAANLVTGEMYGGEMNYNANDVIELRLFYIREGKLYMPGVK